MKRRTIVTMVMVCALAVASSPALAGGAEVGSKAPEFTLKDHRGDTVNLSDFEGSVRVLEWTNPDCPFVKRHYEAGTMKRLAADFADRGVVWLTINSTHSMDRDANAAFAKKYGLDVPVLVDQDGTVGRAYGAATTPHMFVIDGDGTIVYAGAIDDDPRGTEKAPVNYVAAALEQVVEGRPVEVSESRPYGCSVKYASGR